MNRRDLIKKSLALAALSTVSLNGCSDSSSNPNSRLNSANILDINPNPNFDNNLESNANSKEVYSISAPLPFDYALIDRMKELNLEYKKAKIKTLYNSLPFPLALKLEGYHSRRGINQRIKTIDDFLEYVNYAKKQGFDFVYTLNSPKPFSNNDFKKTSKELFNLLDRLKEAKINKIKVANTQLLNILSEKYPNFELHSSTAFEYHNISQYINLLKNYPNIKLIDIAIDENRNFEFLANLREKFPKVELEIMTNEPCLRGCPSRIAHCATTFCEFNCTKILEKNWILEFVKSGVIYPWNLSYYKNIGINHFKFVCAGYVRADIKALDYLTYYLSMLEDPKEAINNATSREFFDKVLKFYIDTTKIKDVKLSKLIPYLPDINYFIKNGSKCAVACDVNCSYCSDCAKKLEKILT